MPLEKRLFTTGMDGDSDEKLVEATAYRYALNIRSMSSDGANIGSIESVRGNTEVLFTLPAGTNKVIGSFDYKTYNKVYYFVFNSLGNHSILEYTASANTIVKVLQNSVLKFDANFLITGINVVELDLTNHLLYWTDDKNEPRKINIEKGKLHSQGDFVKGYASPFLEHFIFRIKAPQPCQPTVAYADDSTKNVNLLENKLFQFKVAYIYDDFEKSAWSPISVVPFPKLICGANPTEKINNNIKITVQTGSSIVKRILIAEREGNTGDFVLITDLDKTLLNIASNTTHVYSFYNDKVYNAVEINESIKLFDSVPLASKGQEIIEGERIADGNILEGFDPVTVNAKLSLAFKDDPSPRIFNFKGKVFVRQMYADQTEYQSFQPIHNLNKNGKGGSVPNETVFGGFGKSDVVNGVGSKYKQTIPLGGFVMYLAGTPYYAVSKQPSFPFTAAIQDGEGVMASDESGFTTRACRDNNGNPNPLTPNKKKIRCQIENGGIWSEYTISAPAGRYILRVASHLTKATELSANLDWQKTSTFTTMVGGAHPTEAIIDIKSNGDIYVNGVFTTASGGFIKDTFIADLSNPNLNVFGGAPLCISGYVTDADISPTPTTGPELLNDTRIELAEVHLDFTTSAFSVFVLILQVVIAVAVPGAALLTLGPAALALYAIWQGSFANGKVFTDHNGFFWWTAPGSAAVNFNKLELKSIKVSGNLRTDFQQFDMNGAVFVPVYTIGMNQGIFRAVVFNYSNGANGTFANERTKLQGSVKLNDGITGVKGINVTSTRGGTDKTLSDGSFDLIVYGDTELNNPRNDFIVYNLSNNCIATFDDLRDDYSISILSTTSSQTFFDSPYNGSYDFDSPVQIRDKTVSILGAGSTVSLKRGSVYQFGIVYYDHSNRSGLTNTNDELFTKQDANGKLGLKLEIPFFTEINTAVTPNAIFGKSSPVISWNVFHQPPPFATHWQWVRTRNSFNNRYLQFTAKAVEYVKDDRTGATGAAATKIGINIQNIANYKTKFGDSILAYVPEVNDRIRFIKDADGHFFNSYIDLKIRDIDPAGRVYVDNISSLPTLLEGFLFEIYTPKLQSPPATTGVSEIFFEFGECYEVGDAGLPTRFHKGQTQNQSIINLSFVTYNPFGKDTIVFQTTTPHNLIPGTILNIAGTSISVVVVTIDSPTQFQSNLLYSTTPSIVHPLTGIFNIAAQGTFSNGDTYSRIRSIPYGIDTKLTPAEQAASSATQADKFIEDANFSDFFKSKVEDIGRPNRVDNTFRQIRRKNTIFFSEKFIPETKINGLSSVFDTNFETYEAQYGGIQKLFNRDLELDCYMELKAGHIPVNQVQFQSTAISGSSVVGASKNVLNPIQYYQGEYGIGLNPESFAEYGGRRYFADLNRGVVIRLSQDGITVISDYKMHNFFTDKSKAILATGIRPNIYGVFDVKFDEYIVAYEEFTLLIRADKILGETLAFNEKYNRWSSFYSFLPEGMATSGVDIVTFKDGKLFTHNSNSSYNNFYGAPFSSEVHVICNSESSKVKVLLAVSEECTETWEATDIITQEGQSSNLILSDFEEKENMQYAAVLRNANTPNVVNPLIEGDQIRSTSFLIKLKNSLTTTVKMFAVNFLYQFSERSNK